jgi:Periplasmic glucans biosynthesis protein
VRRSCPSSSCSSLRGGRSASRSRSTSSSRPASASVEFDPALFDYGKNKLDPKALRGLGFNGFRVHYAINKPGYKDEVLVFQGASYFRALGKGELYGLSARGLAVDTGAAEGEEFPRFVEFWIERRARTRPR